LPFRPVNGKKSAGIWRALMSSNEEGGGEGGTSHNPGINKTRKTDGSPRLHCLGEESEKRTETSSTWGMGGGPNLHSRGERKSIVARKRGEGTSIGGRRRTMFLKKKRGLVQQLTYRNVGGLFLHVEGKHCLRETRELPHLSGEGKKVTGCLFLTTRTDRQRNTTNSSPKPWTLGGGSRVPSGQRY